MINTYNIFVHLWIFGLICSVLVWPIPSTNWYCYYVCNRMLQITQNKRRPHNYKRTRYHELQMIMVITQWIVRLISMTTINQEFFQTQCLPVPRSNRFLAKVGFLALVPILYQYFNLWRSGNSSFYKFIAHKAMFALKWCYDIIFIHLKENCNRLHWVYNISSRDTTAPQWLTVVLASVVQKWRKTLPSIRFP